MVNWAALTELWTETTFPILLIGLDLLAHALGGFHDVQASLETSAGIILIATALTRRKDEIRMRSAKAPK